MSKRVISVPTLLLTAACLAQVSPLEKARPEFIEVEQFARRPAAEQKAGIAAFYRDIAPRHLSSVVLMILSSHPEDILNRQSHATNGNAPARWAVQLADAARTDSAEAVADKLEIAVWQRIGSHLRTLEVLRSNAEDVKALVKSDLESDNLHTFKRGCDVISAIQLKEFVPTLVETYLAGGEKGKFAKNALIWVTDDSVATRMLKEVERDPKSIVLHADLLMHGIQTRPAENRPAPKLLIDLLANPDPEIRLHAARALSTASDPALAEPALKLVNENTPELREMGILLVMNLNAETFSKITDRLEPAMKSPDDRLRSLAIKAFAQHKDPRAAAPLLEMLKRTDVSQQDQTSIMQALSELTDGKVRYDMHQWGAEKNRKGLQQLEDWIKAHPVRR